LQVGKPGTVFPGVQYLRESHFLPC
jgi:hypothetical protein